MKSLRCSIFVCLLVLSACFDQTDKGKTSSASSVPTSKITFTGAQQASNVVTGVSIQWSSGGTGVDSYRVYKVSGGTSTLIATLPSTASSYIDGNVTWGQVYNYTVKLVDSNGLEDSNTKVVSSLSWGGIASVNALSRTSLLVTFNGIAPVADKIRIYIQPASGGARTLVGTATGSDLTYQIDNLNIGYTYKITAQAYLNSLGKEDGNSLNFSAATKTYGYDDDGLNLKGYRSVSNLRAFGDAPGAPISPTLAARTPQSKQIELMWPAFFGLSDPTTEYVVVRTQAGAAIDTSVATPCTPTSVTTCRACRVAGSGILTCKDTQIAAPPARYDYAIALIQKSGGQEWVEAIPSDKASQFKITVQVPPSNMVLVQRDAVNREMCGTMGLTSDPLNHNRCPYSGLAATPYSTGPNKPPLTFDPGYYDFGYNLFVDRFEAACNWTRVADGGNCSSTGSSGDCIGTSDPSPIQGSVGQVYWTVRTASTTAARCWVKTASGWLSSSSSPSIEYTTKDYQDKIMTSDPAPGFRPPFSYVYAQQASLLCNAKTDPYYGPKRLPRVREKVAFLAWPTDLGDPYYLTNTVISQIKSGNVTLTSKCNTGSSTSNSSTGPWSNPYNPTSIAEILTPGNEGADSGQLQSGAANFRRNLFIGSYTSADCVSRYGVQDGVGNAQEISSDIWESYLTTTPDVQTFVGGISPFDNGNRDLAGIRMDGVFGFGGASVVFGSGMPYASTTGINTFMVPLGLPLATNSSVYTPRANVAYLNDYFSWGSSGASTAYPYARSIIYGGRVDSSTGAGRWNLDFSSTQGLWEYTGFRCTLPAE